eukprot:COSAG03_NODE_502_length_7397_cov_43.776469_8_plen_530_part_00
MAALAGMPRRDAAERAQLVARVRANDTTLVDVDWAFGGVTDAELQILAAALCGNRHVRTLDLNYNTFITDQGIQALVDVLPSCTLCKVVADGTPLVTRGTRDRLIRKSLGNVLAAVRANDPAVDLIDLSEMALEDSHLLLVAEALQNNQYVHSVGLWKNDWITAEGMAPFIVALGSSAVCTVSVTNCPASTDEAMLASLQAVCVPRCLALLKANTIDLDEISIEHIWHSGMFDDSAADALAAAIENNTRLQRIWLTAAALPNGGWSLTDAGAAHLERALGNGVCGVVCVNVDCVELPASRVRSIGGHCFENALRRVAENDPLLTELDLRFGQVQSDTMVQHELEQGGIDRQDTLIGVHEMTRLAAVLHGNTELREILVDKDTPEAAVRVLIDVLPCCLVECAVFHPDRYNDDIHLQVLVDRLAELSGANRSRRRSAAASLVLHRPFQRLAVGALSVDSMYATTQPAQVRKRLAISHDLLEMIIHELDKSTTSPYTQAKYQELPSHKVVFAWHAIAQGVSAQKRRRVVRP